MSIISINLRQIIPLFAFVFTLFLSTSLSALSVMPITYSLTDNYSGDSPNGDYSITFSEGNPGEVNVTMAASGMGMSEQVVSWFFNINKDLTNLQFNHISGPEALQINTGSQMAEGGLLFDIKFDFTDQFNSFMNPAVSMYSISDTFMNLSPTDFMETSSNGNIGPFHSVANIQNINQDGQGWVGDEGGDNGGMNGNGETPVPEPSTYLLLATMLAFVLYRKRKEVLGS